MKRWPVIRHGRAIGIFLRSLGMMWAYVFRAVFIWGVRSPEGLSSVEAVKYDRERTRATMLRSVKIWLDNE